jgi:3-methyladenine DNA glycosylase AlkC
VECANGNTASPWSIKLKSDLIHKIEYSKGISIYLKESIIKQIKDLQKDDPDFNYKLHNLLKSDTQNVNRQFEFYVGNICFAIDCDKNSHFIKQIDNISLT